MRATERTHIRASRHETGRIEDPCKNFAKLPADSLYPRLLADLRPRPLSAPADVAANPRSLHVSWDQYNTLVERLALEVYESGYGFNQIICIARGGLRVGDVLSRIFEMPLAILSTHSYSAEGGTTRGELVIAEHMTMTKPRLGDRVLLVDDMVDSGHTLAAVHAELPRRFQHISELKTAVLWWKACSIFRPDFSVEYLSDSPWIHQPFEIYDTLRPDALAERLQSKGGK